MFGSVRAVAPLRLPPEPWLAASLGTFEISCLLKQSPSLSRDHRGLLRSASTVSGEQENIPISQMGTGSSGLSRGSLEIRCLTLASAFTLGTVGLQCLDLGLNCLNPI